MVLTALPGNCRRLRFAGLVAASLVAAACGSDPSNQTPSYVGATTTGAASSSTSSGADVATTTSELPGVGGASNSATSSGVTSSSSAASTGSLATSGTASGSTASATSTTGSAAATTSGSATGGGGAAATTTTSSTTGNPTPSSGCGLATETGTFQDSVDVLGNERTYHMSVPDSYDASLPQRLVFGYHGSNYTGELMRRYLDLERSPLLEGTLFVYPDGIALEGQPDHIGWELGAEERDIAFFDALLEQLKARYCIDESRIFVNGQSFGGMMTNAVGCIRGDVVRAIAAVAGSGPRGSSCTGQVAVWLTHGVDDDSVSFSSGEGSRDHWIQANGCDSSAVTGNPAQCQEYQGCDAGYPVIWCPHENDGGHQHPSFGRAAVREFLASF